MGIEFLLGAQVVATLAGFVLVWLRLGRIADELRSFRARLESEEEGRKSVQRAHQGVSAVTSEKTAVVVETPEARAARAWGVGRPPAPELPPISSELRIGTALGLAAILPAFGWLGGLSLPLSASAGVVISGLMMLAALRPQWRVASWAGAATGAVWAFIGLILGAAGHDPLVLSVSLCAASVGGYIYALKREVAPSATHALVLGAAALTLAYQTDMVAPAGISFAGVALLAALTGSINLRLEAFYVGAFVASLVGLFVLSGQESAAIWFTPAAAWTGAVFLAIAFVRVPQLGSRGVTQAGAGSLAPFAVIAGLSAAGHGLVGPYAVSGSFLALAAIYATILALAMRRREGRLEALGATLWMLAIFAFLSIACAIIAAAPAPIATGSFVVCALLLAILDSWLPHAAWRVLACLFGAFAAAYAVADAQLVLTESPLWPAWVIVGGGMAVPAALAGGVAWQAQRNGTPLTAGAFELLAAALGVVAGNLAVRLIFTAGATQLQPMDFVEASAHICVWLAAALVVAANARGSLHAARTGASGALAAAALGAGAIAAFLWLTPYWEGRTNLLSLPQPLGFLAPSVMLAAHWVFWRARGSQLRTRVSLGASAAFLAACATLLVSQSDGLPDWVAALLGALSFAFAIAINFAPGIAMNPARRRYLRERRMSSGMAG